MSPTFIKGCGEALAAARITFDKLHMLAHTHHAVDRMRRIEQRGDLSLKGMRWTLLRAREDLTPAAAADPDALIARLGLKGAVARNSRPPADQRRARHARSLVHRHHALEGRLDEGGRRAGAPASGRHRRLGVDPPDQRLPRGSERTVRSRRAMCARFRPLRHHPHRAVSHRRQPRLRRPQPSCLSTHLKFNIAEITDWMLH